MESNLSDVFFSELKQYNPKNFHDLIHADLANPDAVAHKCCSSVVTRYFIFADKHPEIPVSDLKVLYYQLRIDMLAKYFAEYPSASSDNLQPFQKVIRQFAGFENKED